MLSVAEDGLTGRPRSHHDYREQEVAKPGCSLAVLKSHLVWAFMPKLVLTRPAAIVSCFQVLLCYQNPYRPSQDENFLDLLSSLVVVLCRQGKCAFGRTMERLTQNSVQSGTVLCSLLSRSTLTDLRTSRSAGPVRTLDLTAHVRAKELSMGRSVRLCAEIVRIGRAMASCDPRRDKRSQLPNATLLPRLRRERHSKSPPSLMFANLRPKSE